MELRRAGPRDLRGSGGSADAGAIGGGEGAGRRQRPDDGRHRRRRLPWPDRAASRPANGPVGRNPPARRRRADAFAARNARSSTISAPPTCAPAVRARRWPPLYHAGPAARRSGRTAKRQCSISAASRTSPGGTARATSSPSTPARPTPRSTISSRRWASAKWTATARWLPQARSMKRGSRNCCEHPYLGSALSEIARPLRFHRVDGGRARRRRRRGHC